MAKSCMTLGQYVSLAAGATVYMPVAEGPWVVDATESKRQITYRDAGTFSNLRFRIISNRGAVTVTLHIDGVDGNQSIVTAAAPSGEYEDAVNTDVITTGKKMSYEFVGGGGGNSQYGVYIGISFTASSNTVTKLAAIGTYGEIIPDTAYYIPIAGTGASTDYEPQINSRFNVAGTLKNLFVNISANARGSNTIFGTRKNESTNGNLIITVAGGATGIFEDTVNTDVVAVDDLWSYRVYCVSDGIAAITREVIAVSFITTGDGAFQKIAYNPNGISFLTASTTRVFHLSGLTITLQTAANEIRTQQKAGVICTASNYSVFVLTNGRTTTTTFYFRVDGVNSAMLVAFDGGVTGWLEDAVNTVELAEANQINTALVTGTGVGTIQFYTITTLMTLPALEETKIPVIQDYYRRRRAS